MHNGAAQLEQDNGRMVLNIQLGFDASFIKTDIGHLIRDQSVLTYSTKAPSIQSSLMHECAQLE